MKISYEQLQNAADNGGNFVEDLANGARGAVCNAYHNYKDWYHQNIDLLSPPGQLLENFWDNVCPLEPPYQPPTPPTPQPGETFYNCGVWHVDGFEQFIDAGGTPGTHASRYYDAMSLRRVDVSGYDVFYLAYTDCDGIEHPAQNEWGGWIASKTTITKVGDCPCAKLPPPAPPNQIDDIVPVGDGDDLIDVPIKINPQIQLPSVNVNVFAPIFKPDFDFNLNPQFNIKPNINIIPTINFNFGADGVDVGIGKPGGDNPDSFDINLGDNINNIVNNVNNLIDGNDTINNTVNQIKDKLACDPCEKLEDIKKILEYQPVYRSNSTGEFQSITRDNLFNLGYLEIEITQLPNTNKIVFGGNSDNSLYTGWLFWRMNGYNFEKVQITSEKSVYWSPKWANGFGITCTHNSRANCYYYIEDKD